MTTKDGLLSPTSVAQTIVQFHTFKGEIERIREENRIFHEKKDNELKDLSNQISQYIVSLGATGVPVNGLEKKRTIALHQLPSSSTAVNQTNNGGGGANKRQKTDATITSNCDGMTVDSEGYTIVHTDGACSNNGKAGAKAGIGVWWAKNSIHNLSQPVVGGRHTNNTAEIQAATLAIGQAKGLKINKLNIHTDSQFLIKCITEWMPNWKKKNWMTSNKQPVKNKEDLEVLDHEIQEGGLQIKWTHVRGHSGILGNEEADKLAVAGANK